MKPNEAYKLGYERGYNICSWVDVPEIGSKLTPDVDWQGIGVIETVDDQKDAVQLIAHESESINRDYTPFEFTAHAFNQCENSEELWEEFDRGISEGILAYIGEHLNDLEVPNE